MRTRYKGYILILTFGDGVIYATIMKGNQVVSTPCYLTSESEVALDKLRAIIDELEKENG